MQKLEPESGEIATGSMRSFYGCAGLVAILVCAASLIAGILVGMGQIALGVQMQNLVCVAHLACLQFAATWAVLGSRSYFRRSLQMIVWLAIVVAMSYLGRYLGLTYYRMSGFVYLQGSPLNFDSVINVPSWVMAQMPFWFLRLGLGWRLASQHEPNLVRAFDFFEAAFFVALASASVWLIGAQLNLGSLDSFAESARSFLVTSFLVMFSFVTICWPLVYHCLKPARTWKTTAYLATYVSGMVATIILVNLFSKQRFTTSDAVVGTLVPILLLAGGYGLLLSTIGLANWQIVTNRLLRKNVKSETAETGSGVQGESN